MLLVSHMLAADLTEHEVTTICGASRPRAFILSFQCHRNHTFHLSYTSNPQRLVKFPSLPQLLCGFDHCLNTTLANEELRKLDT